MTDKISEKIDTYARAHLKELRGKENGRYKLTKYDVAQYMLSQGQLSESDFASWMNTQEGYQNLNISNKQKQALQRGSIFSFDNPLTPEREKAYLDELDTNFKRDSLTGVVLERTTQKQKISSTPSKELQKEAEIRKNTIEVLLNNAKTAQAMINQYHASIGYISSDAVVQGMNTIGNLVWDSWSGRGDFVTVFEQESGLENEIKALEGLKSKTTKPKEFEREFKKLYGVDFEPKNFEKLADASKELNEMNSYSGLSNYFGFGIEKLKDSDTSGLEPASLLAPVFGNNVLKAKEYVEELRKECKDENDLREKLIQILTESKSEADKKLAGFDRAKIENDYKSAYKAAMGEYKSDEIISGYIESSKMNAMLTETGLIVAGSLLSMGSSSLLVLKPGAKEIMKMMCQKQLRI